MKKRIIWFFIIIVIGFFGLLFLKTGFTVEQITGLAGGHILPGRDVQLPEKNENRINVLLLGMRGIDEPGDGKLLTDTMILLSYNKQNNKAALISIPRDLYLTMPGENYKEKINFAYALGYEKKGAAGGLFLSKVAVSKVTGLYMDYAVAVDHNAFKEIVDILGGIDVYLDKPFSEKTQFEKEILLDLPVGKSHLDGRTALYFVRSRYSTSDFDRVRRQQLVLVAIKEKALSSGILANPVKIYQLLEALGRNVRADMEINLAKIKEFVDLVQNFGSQPIIHKVFDTSPEGLLSEAHTEKGVYILLPANGDFSKIQKICNGIFN